MIFDLSGHIQLGLTDGNERVRRSVEALLDPYRPSVAAVGDAHVSLEVRSGEPHPWRDVHNPAGDGVVTASDGTSLYLVRDGRSCLLPVFDRPPPLRFAYEPGFPIWSVFASVVRPSLHLALLDQDAVAVHSASVALDGRGIVVAGWSETGKTETALALLELGARFVSDKWTILDAHARISPFPISVGVRRWVLPYLPTLRAALPRRATFQLALSGAADRLTRPARRSSPRGGAAAMAVTALDRMVALGDRAALRPSELAAAYGQETPARNVAARCVALLTTTSETDVTVVPADPAWAARRLARSAAFERRALFALDRRARYAFPDRVVDLESDVVAKEEGLLRAFLAGMIVLEVLAPFPTDPRRVATAIASQLR